MVDLNILVPIAFFFLVYLSLQIIKSNFFFVYLVQLKEYRFDRLQAHFRTVSGKKQLLELVNILKWRMFYRPRFTLRAMLTLLLSFGLQYNFFFLSLRALFRLLKDYFVSVPLLLVSTLFFLNLLVPLTVFLASFITHLFMLPLKQLIINLAKKKISRANNLLVIGITGSYGKTAVKEILSHLLSSFYNVLKTPMNCNTKLGIANLILNNLRARHEILVVEMGAYKKGEIKEICEMVKPKIGIITGINEQHLELFGSIDKTQWAKFELIKSLPKDGLAVFNAKSQYMNRLIKASRVQNKVYGKRKGKFKTGLPGEWNKENIEAALIVSDYLKMSKVKLLERIAALNKISLGLEVSRGIKGARVIDDTYSSNPAGFMVALEMLKKTRGTPKVLITPGIIELGKSSDNIHKKIAKEAGSFCSHIFLTKPDFKESFEKGLGKPKAEAILEVEEDELELIEKLKNILRHGSAVLLEGRLPHYLVKKIKG
ncbi:hypothetical protein COT75_02700 [Candidatus Beckwithbacteria bacterium CG10_big_fil_rev_8_21_14_0_10_34_10]|uniref:Mur ligase central domain-containing protein n=1 Tax=Candidatus Beckwithbacteria bacterium CG10_big_fil_rev_8_21_14_0_10_34_10 TaxID=1974495 RepID=A0A2H0W9A7_9BACT|nr:MAG: hypothetical protein COT75_02700 [Candidatus Beckwithbacteria bacterium CG10_big_fil_rev_8_21_14_0_10_34_10]